MAGVRQGSRSPWTPVIWAKPPDLISHSPKIMLWPPIFFRCAPCDREYFKPRTAVFLLQDLHHRQQSRKTKSCNIKTRFFRSPQRSYYTGGSGEDPGRPWTLPVLGKKRKQRILSSCCGS